MRSASRAPEQQCRLCTVRDAKHRALTSSSLRHRCVSPQLKRQDLEWMTHSVARTCAFTSGSHYVSAQLVYAYPADARIEAVQEIGSLKELMSTRKAEQERQRRTRAHKR
eukprot:2463635-Pleurochrysis_carterae.AAC.2